VNSSLTVEIEDNGVGIMPEHFQRFLNLWYIFSQEKGKFPWIRLHRSGSCSYKGLVELLKGTISFESRLNEGTKFICVFPDVHEVNSGEMIKDPVDD